MIYYQTIDNHQIRSNRNKGTIIIFSLESGKILTDLSLIFKEKWANFNFPNSLYGEFMNYQNISDGGTGEEGLI